MDRTIDLKPVKPKKQSAADRLINAAGPLFSEQPFDAVSTREIAKAAEVNLSAISYHFGSKEGLYEALICKILEDLKPIRQGLADFLNRGIEASTGNRDMQRETVRILVSRVIASITSDENPRWRIRLMMRELQKPGRCFNLIMNEHINVVHNLIGRLIASIIEKPEESVTVKVACHSILGMCLQYGLNEALLSHRLGWVGYGPREIEIITTETVDLVHAMLGLKTMPFAESE